MVTQVQGASGQFQTSLLASIGNQFQNFAAAIGQGLSRVLAQAQGAPVPQFGQRYAPVNGNAFQGNVAGYRVMGDKAKGVEPGFIAKRDWTPGDAAKLQNPQHKFHAKALELATGWLAANPQPQAPSDQALDAMLQRALAVIAGSGSPHAESAAELLEPDTDGAAPNVLAGLRANNGLDAGFEAELARELVQEAFAGSTQTADATRAGQANEMLDRLRQGVMDAMPKFNKNHYIKLDYYEADKSGDKYQIPLDKSKGVLHRWYTGATAKDRNEGAVREALANDLMRSLGIQSQKLKIVEGQYADGTPKLMLDGTHVDGANGNSFSDFDGKPLRGERYLKDGVLVRNTQAQGDAPGVFSGPPRLDPTMVEFGRNKILLLLMADRDALGSKGGNKGYVGNTFVGIDPGHALEGDLLGRRGDIRSDFSFKQPGVVPGQGYKNFTMFDQSTLSEKMEGVRQIARLRESGADGQLFDLYSQQFGNARPAAANFDQHIQNIKAQYEGRRDDILQIFQERLAVDDFDFGVAPASDAHTSLRDVSLNLLDGLEKFTSPTTSKTSSGIQLLYPQITDSAKRKEWHIGQDAATNEVVFTCPASKSDVAKMRNDLQRYLQPIIGRNEDFLQISPDRTVLSLRVPVDRLADFGGMLSSRSIIEHKHPSRT
ncbi:hypothetical protein [Achromobacter agilis]|uniref:Uncharacterized protein n=1 Tax=Achromobacter agilis TaxID=1353888 RepID=A0A446CB58_9BURK|nr:hypothetical protein [Achromobacter agilis]SSW65074.1 hypothetical protein AGI3411_01957 [Achromobacter agilis]